MSYRGIALFREMYKSAALIACRYAVGEDMSTATNIEMPVTSKPLNAIIQIPGKSKNMS